MDVQDNPIYAAVLEPDEVRKDLLLASRDVLNILKAYESFHLVQDLKHARLHELRKVTEELLILNRKLRLALPKTQLKSPPPLLPNIPLLDSDNQDTDALDYLEQELGKIEKELKGLS